jgi:hypothetical protein
MFTRVLVSALAMIVVSAQPLLAKVIIYCNYSQRPPCTVFNIVTAPLPPIDGVAAPTPDEKYSLQIGDLTKDELQALLNALQTKTGIHIPAPE